MAKCPVLRWSAKNGLAINEILNQIILVEMQNWTKMNIRNGSNPSKYDYIASKKKNPCKNPILGNFY